MNYQWHRNCRWEGFRRPQKSQEHAAAEPLLPLLLLLICACTASAHTLFSLTYILSISLGERFGVLSSSFMPPGQFEYGLVLFLFCFFLSLFFPQSSRGYRCGLNTFYSSPSFLTRFLKSAVTSLVNTARLRKPVDTSLLSWVRWLFPKFSSTSVYCSLLSTWAKDKKQHTSKRTK